MIVGKSLFMLTAADEVVDDEVELLSATVELSGMRVAELGCGNGRFARQLLARASVGSIIAFEVDATQHHLNLTAASTPSLEFRFGGAEAISLESGSVDGVVMMRSLHHVPVPLLDRALVEIHRVLVPGGWLYVSEPIYAGDLNDIIKLFHDERIVREKARAALQAAAAEGLLEEVSEKEFLTPVVFRDYDDFVAKVVRATHTAHVYRDDVAAEVRSRFDRVTTLGGARFLQPTRVNLFRRPAV